MSAMAFLIGKSDHQFETLTTLTLTADVSYHCKPEVGYNMRDPIVWDDPESEPLSAKFISQAPNREPVFAEFVVSIATPDLIRSG